MNIFKRHFNRKAAKLQEITSKYQGDTENKKSNSTEGLKTYISEQMNFITEQKNEYENSKKEYQMITSYLNDIQKIKELTEDDAKKIQEIAHNIITLTRTKEVFVNSDKKISDSQFLQFEQMEDEIPKAIAQMKDNESYQSVVKKDLDYLEGEKTEWLYEKRSLAQEQKTLKSLSLLCLLSFILALVIQFVLKVAFAMNVEISLTFTFAIGAILGFLLFARRQNNVLLIKQAEACINKSVVLQNKIKLKYVNITSAVDYEHEKYHVHNYQELNYQWGVYLEMIKEREKLLETNEDIDYYIRMLMKELQCYQLYDTRIWTNQVEALADSKEMVEVKHTLLIRRKKLRSRMEAQYQEMDSKAKEIEVLLKSNTF